MQKTTASTPITTDILSHAVRNAGLTPQTLTAVHSWLSEQLQAQEYAKLGQGGHTQNKVPLRMVFVDLPVSDPKNFKHQSNDRNLFLTSLLASEPLKLNAVCKITSRGEFDLADVEEIQKNDRLNTKSGFSSTLLIGGPGQGKSTICQLACQLHRAALLLPSKDSLPSTTREIVNTFEIAAKKTKKQHPIKLPKRPYLPLEISLPDFSAWNSKDVNRKQSSTIPALIRFLADLPSAKSSKLSATNLTILACELPLLIVFDGFDEVGATHDRAHLVEAARELLTYLAERNGVAQVIATTRPQGYAGELGKIGITLNERWLVPLSKNEALEYARKLVEAKISGSDSQQKALTRLREAAEESSTQRLLTTPLQVTILTALVQQLGRAPRERWNLFYRYFSYTYDREIERDTYASKLLANHRSHIEQIHARVGLLLQVEAERDGGGAAKMSRKRLEDVIEAVLSEDEVDEQSRKELIKDIAIAAEQRLVFLVEPEPGNFGFEIRSLQEFMAAWAITSGREAEISARLTQISKAPMFRNVFLFAASRLFSEGSPLRSNLTDQICYELDNDQSNEAYRVTKAGAILALEMLEEGAVLSQPKYARALMQSATSLLSLPVGNVHVRLTNVLNSDTENILRSNLENRLNFIETEEKPDLRPTWLCIVIASNLGKPWATTLAEEFWDTRADPVLLVDDCTSFDVPLSKYFIDKFNSNLDKFPSPFFFDGTNISEEIDASYNWVTWLCYFYKHRWQEGRVYSFSLRAIPRNFQCSPQPEKISIPPGKWTAWIKVAQFELVPNKDTLSSALYSIAENLPSTLWDELVWFSSWPLSICLKYGEPKLIKEFALQARNGELGDINDWLVAQETWGGKIDIARSLESVGQRVPWSQNGIKSSPPISLIPTWDFQDRLRYKFEAKAQEILNKIDSALNISKAKNEQKMLAEICFILAANLPKKSNISILQIEKWAGHFPIPTSFLFPRPKWLSHSEWLKLLPTADLPNTYILHYSLSAFIKEVNESNAHPFTLRLLILILEHHQRRRIKNPPEWSEFQETIKRISATLEVPTLDVMILQVFAGVLPAAHDLILIERISTLGNSSTFYWRALLAAIESNALSTDRITAILISITKSTIPEYRYITLAVNRLHAVLQIHKSELENYAVWNKLTLPLPHPNAQSDTENDGEIPTHPIVIESFEVRNICGLKQISIAPSRVEEGKGQWLVIIGMNGIGKTTLLRSLVLALRNTKNPAIWPRGTFAASWQHLTKGDNNLSEARISVKLANNLEHTTIIRQDYSISISQSPEQLKPRLFPIFAYGCRRGSAMGGIARNVDLTDDDGPEIATLFDEGASLIHAETWLLQLEGDSTKNSKSKILFRSVIAAMKMMLEVESIDIFDKKVWITEHGRPQLPFSSLSDGYLTSAGWFLDLIARWVALAERNNIDLEEDFLIQMRGLVLIDEIDLHLHPSWQIEIIARTKKIMPQMSFIVTTHNPLTLVGARAEDIWILENQDNRIVATSGIDAPMLLTSSQIYRRYFGVNSIYPNGLAQDLQRYSFLSGYTFRNESEQEELEFLEKKLAAEGLEIGWDVVPKEIN